MQSNLHRVSEFAVTAMQRADDGKVKPETRTVVKRLRESDSDTESEVDEIVSNSNISASLDLNVKDSTSLDPWHDCLKPETAEVDSTVFLSFGLENEDPYEKAVERYYPLFNICNLSKTVRIKFSLFCCILLLTFTSITM